MTRLALLITLVLAVSGAACNQRDAPDERTDQVGTSGAAASGRNEGDCVPSETRQPNAPHQRPEFAGQTRACTDTSDVEFDVVVLASGLQHPWAIEPLPGGDLLVTERPGRMRIVTAKGDMGAPIAGVPDVDARDQGGLLDVALSPEFDSDRTTFWSYTEPRQDGNATSVAKAMLSADRRGLEQVQVIFRSMPAYQGDKHFGSRLLFDRNGLLYITLGERSDTRMRPHAQRLSSHLGKIVRIKSDGSVPDDNPFVDTPDALPEIWTRGHRNVQATAFDQNGRLWAVEHGTRGGDELNLIEEGKNYGWPIVAYGIEYAGGPIVGAETTRAGHESPRYYWDPVIAPSGAEFYTGRAFPDWRGSLFVGSLKDRTLVRLALDDERVTGEEHLLSDRRQRVRDVRQGPDGALYVVTDEANGELWRIAPR
jgi:glucose/arabinose dehydrogenase